MSENDQQMRGCYSKDEMGEGKDQFSSINDHCSTQAPSAENLELASEGYKGTAYYRFGFHEKHPVPAPTWPIIWKLLGNGLWDLPHQSVKIM